MTSNTHPVGSFQSRVGSMVRCLGSTIRDQAYAIGMPHATLARRLHNRGDFTVTEVQRILKALSKHRGGQRCSLRISSEDAI